MLSATTIGGFFLLYLLGRAFYRLFLHPLAKIPGPTIAAVTDWYCIYHDFIRGGQYVWVIEKMHRKYGPVVRIRPNVVHVNDPNFIDELYSSAPSLRRERAHTVLNMFVKQLSVLPTRDHHLHRQRRSVLSKFFSQRSVRQLVPVINDTLANVLRRMEGWAKDGKPVSMNVAWRAATKDVIQSYAMGEGRKCLEMEDCNAAFFNTISTQRMAHLSVHFNWLMLALQKFPPPILTALNPNILGFIDFVQDLEKQIKGIQNAKDQPEGRTVFHEILQSNLSEREKSTERLVDEAMVLAIAGSDTTAGTLVSLTYHILSDRKVFTRLREELDSVMPDPNQFPDPVKLDSLPYLNALIEEALRLYPSATHRQDRVAPDQDLIFTYANGKTLSIPAGTIVGMTAPLVNRHPAWYEKPDEFYPERYLENPKLFHRHFSFSKGMRQCLGMNLAYQELQTFTAGIFRKYGLYDETLSEQNGPTLELFETDIEDVKMYADFVTPGFRPGSQGVRVRIRQS